MSKAETEARIELLAALTEQGIMNGMDFKLGEELFLREVDGIFVYDGDKTADGDPVISAVDHVRVRNIWRNNGSPAFELVPDTVQHEEGSGQ